MTTSPADTPGHQVRYDLAVLGAGPAGLAAAVAAAAAGARVALVDEGARTGGQYWRHRPGDIGARHHGRPVLQRLRDGLAAHADRIDHLAGHTVWHVERSGSDTQAPDRRGDFTTYAVSGGAGCDGTERTVVSRAVVVATGAYDRQLPFPGWTVPGVLTAGAAQALLKGHGVLAGRRIVVAGTGPFLLAVAAGLAEAGARVAGVYEAGLPTAFARHPLALAGNPAKLAEGAGFLRTLARHRVPYRTRTAVIAAHGTDEVTGVTLARLDARWRTVPGSERRLECDTLAVGHGFTPQIEIPLQLGCATRRDADGSLVAVADTRQLSTVPGVYLAGEVCGVGGAAQSVVEGELAGLHAAFATVGTRPGAAAVRRLLRRRAAGRRFATALHAAYPVRPGWLEWLRPDTVVCRCEEVTVEAVEAAVTDLGATSARAVKLYARPGMGLCQGRVCGYATTCLVADRTGREPTEEDLRSLAGRPIAQPLSLGTLAAGHHPTPP
ncbi:FAD-dependent oxidoreductase [Streptomyces sp. NPDC101062]|uniref:FAD-dependent oxidoreductase n=1 Tax=unclassified Streptomyces TaxID=2593676 RepID=UPI00381F12E8